LSGSLVASSFGKLVTKEEPRQGVREEDLALALLMMITNNIGQVAYLVAQLQKCSKIFFVGNFLRQNPISCRRLAYAISFWSGGKMEAMFLAHEGHFGALGTFLTSAFGEDVDKVIGINNILVTKPAAVAPPKQGESGVTGGVSSKGSASGAAGVGHKKSRSADAMETALAAAAVSDSCVGETGVQYVDAAAARTLRSLRGRSFSDDYAMRTLKERHTPRSPKTPSTMTAASAVGAGSPVASASKSGSAASSDAVSSPGSDESPTSETDRISDTAPL
jgi:hypothetical protein